MLLGVMFEKFMCGLSIAYRTAVEPGALILPNLHPRFPNPIAHSDGYSPRNPEALRPSAHTDGGYAMGRYWVQAKQLVRMKLRAYGCWESHLLQRFEGQG